MVEQVLLALATVSGAAGAALGAVALRTTRRSVPAQLLERLRSNEALAEEAHRVADRTRQQWLSAQESFNETIDAVEGVVARSETRRKRAAQAERRANAAGAQNASGSEASPGTREDLLADARRRARALGVIQ